MATFPALRVKHANKRVDSSYWIQRVEVWGEIAHPHEPDIGWPDRSFQL
jgi:hypothetical protein